MLNGKKEVLGKLVKNKSLRIMTLITAANFAGKLAGFLKDILLSKYYGINEMTDALFLAMSIPTLILGIFTSAADSVIIPQYTAISKNSRKKADCFFSNIICVLTLFSIIATLIMFLFPEYIVKVFASGFDSVQIQYAERFLRFFCIFGLFHVWYVFFNAYSTIYQKVKIRAFLSFSTNMIILCGIVVKHDANMNGLIVSMVIANLLHGILPIFSAMRCGYRYSFNRIDNSEIKQFIQNFLPIVGSAALVELNLFLDKTLASRIGVGALSALDYGAKIPNIFDSMVVIGIAVVIIPHISNLYVNKKKEEIKKYVTKIIWLLGICLLPIMFIMYIYAQEITELVYMRGAFSMHEVMIVADVIKMYAPQVLFVALNSILIKVLHAEQNTKVPFYITVSGVFINALASIILMRYIGIKGIALGTTISTMVNFVTLYIYVRKYIGWVKEEIEDREKLFFGVAVISLSSVLLLFKYILKCNLIMTLCGGVFGVGIYFIIIGLVTYKKYFATRKDKSDLEGF